MDATEKRVKELLSLVLDEACSDAERQELADLLAKRPELAAGTVEEVVVHNLLHWQSEDISHLLTADELVGTHGLPERGVSANAPSRSVVAWMMALAATVLIAGGIAFWNHSPRSADGPIATLVAQSDLKWADGSLPLKDGKLMTPGRLESTGGDFTLRFRTGPVVHFSGPVAMQVESDMLVHLERGQATARVPQSGKGFTMRTPMFNVIDQGTQFGVSVEADGLTDVVVFEGKVDLQKTTARAGQPQQQLVQGEGVRIDPVGAVARLMQIQRDTKGAWSSARNPESPGRVIEEVSDNIPPSDGSKYFCYQITSHGLQDDVYAYADHPHQWNGLTAEGLPAFLRGADYVKTFNDYRYMPDFKMTITPARSCNLYVFTDDRIPAPEWLTDQFEDTGVNIGADEGTHHETPHSSLATGGGKSIDTIFSVWRRRCLDTKPVVLGTAGKIGSEGHVGRAMYGIAATPLD